MIVDIGTDIIEIERIKKVCEKSDRFILKIFTESELSIFGENLDKYNRIAGNFAAKEVCLKILGTGITGMKWKEIEVLRDPSGKPFVNLYGNALKKASDLGIGKILISISHCHEYAIAYGVGIKEMLL